MTPILTAVGALIGIAGGLGGAVGVFTASRQKSTVTTLAADNGALRGRVSTLEGTERECQRRLTHLEASNRLLTETVTSAAKVDALSTAVAANHLEVVRLLESR